MSRRTWSLIGALILISVAGLSADYLAPGVFFKARPGVARYVNCATGDDANSGTSRRRPWRSLSKVSSVTFGPGDSLLFARGTTCQGQLAPKGSGSADNPVTLADYGKGELPRIEGGSSEAAVTLADQSFWEIRNLDVSGGTRNAIMITGSVAGTTMRHIYLKNVRAHDANGRARRKRDGLIAFFPAGEGQRFEDILVDGAVAYGTNLWSGIFVMGAAWPENKPGAQPVSLLEQAVAKGSNITIRNSTVHDVGGDGIVIFSATNGLIERSVAYETGQTTDTRIGTPNSIWMWNCHDCVMQFNEAYKSHSPTEKDGGLFDSDFFNRNVTIQYNYGHDADGYCVGVFGVGGPAANDNSVVRYNICSNNGRRAENSRQGDFYFKSWDGGTIRNARIHNNTVYWNPADGAAPVVDVEADFDLSNPGYFVNNIVYSTSPTMAAHQMAALQLTSDHNIFWPLGARTPQWRVNDRSYESLTAWHAARMDLNSLVADPRLNLPSSAAIGRPATAFTLTPSSPGVASGRRLDNMGDRDFFGNRVPHSGPVSAGAQQFNSPAVQ